MPGARENQLQATTIDKMSNTSTHQTDNSVTSGGIPQSLLSRSLNSSVPLGRRRSEHMVSPASPEIVDTGRENSAQLHIPRRTQAVAHRGGISSSFSRGTISVSPRTDIEGFQRGNSPDLAMNPLHRRRSWNLYSPTDDIPAFIPEQVTRLSETLSGLYDGLRGGARLGIDGVDGHEDIEDDYLDGEDYDDDDEEDEEDTEDDDDVDGEDRYDVWGTNSPELQYLLNLLGHDGCSADSDLISFLTRLRDENVIDAAYFRQLVFRSSAPFEITPQWIASHPGYDMQGIPWKVSGDQDSAKYREVRQARCQMYQSYHDLVDQNDSTDAEISAQCQSSSIRNENNITASNCSAHEPTISTVIPTNTSSFAFLTNSSSVERPIFNFSAGYTRMRPFLLHFQLRNLIAPVSRNEVFVSEKVSGQFEVKCLNPTGRSIRRSISPTDVPLSMRSTDISTIAANRDMLVVGGFRGEYMIKAGDQHTITGRLTSDWNGITNHICLFDPSSAQSNLAVFASNDCFLRQLDVSSGQIESEFSLPWAINCSAFNPLQPHERVLVGDATFAILMDDRVATTRVGSQKGLGTLTGHSDYGFACDWSPDGHTVATGNQDGTCRIYDTRNCSKTLHVHRTTMDAAVRAMKFDSNGSYLALAEPIDYVTVLDTKSGFTTGQIIEMWDEIGGLGFVDGQHQVSESLVIGNCDRNFGGVYVFDKNSYGYYCKDLEDFYL